MQFFHTTDLSFAQTMPMVWRALIVLSRIKTCHIPDLCIEDIPISYRLRSHGSSRFLLFSTSNNLLILKVTKNEDEWKRKLFCFKWDSITEGDNLPVERLTTANFKELARPFAESDGKINAIYRLPESERSFLFNHPVQASIPHPTCLNSSLCVDQVKILEVFDLDELDNYSSPAPVKTKPSPKPYTASKTSASSKPAVIPKPSPETKPHASSSRKRKETDSPATSTEASPTRTMGSLSPVGLERLTNLYEEACGVVKMLEVKLKKAEITIVDKGNIVAKSQHYEDKFKVVTLESQAAVKKATQDAQIKLGFAQTQHEHDMISYREDLKSSTIEAWEAKLKDLGGNPMKYLANPEVGESSKAAEVAKEEGDKTGEDPTENAEANAGGDGEAMVGDDVP
ncbi:hypothetical protein Hanom_Chr06g00548501 [Helianthus anomalus]